MNGNCVRFHGMLPPESMTFWSQCLLLIQINVCGYANVEYTLQQLQAAVVSTTGR